MNSNHNPKRRAKYSFDSKGTFVIEGYNYSKPFSNFFPGIAGIWGIPMWVFYVNRGQCISSFGIEGKDKSIVEFQPANKSYRLTSLQGFRTFLKIKRGSKVHFWEPFQNNCLDSVKSMQRMLITASDLTLEDTHESLGIKIRVHYFTIPEEPFAALVRRVTIINLTRKKYDIEVIDGLPVIVPFGAKDGLMKNISRTIEAWVKVRNVKERIPYYQLNVEVSDTPRVKHIKEGNFYFCFTKEQGRTKLLSPLVEASCVFGHSSGFQLPENFFNTKNFTVPKDQQTNNCSPSAMSYARFSLSSRGTKELISLCGYTHDENELKEIVKKVTTRDFVDQKAKQYAKVIGNVKDYAFTASSSRRFDLYCQQTFLDNVLRGGLPVSLKTAEGNIAFNVFSRKHGDLERDYNHFIIAPTFFSQGNGNYRDVNQNRRNDAWFNRDVKENNIIGFLNLIQADGYNPLIVKGLTFSSDDLGKVERVLSENVKGHGKECIREYIREGFQPGELLNYIDQNRIQLVCSPQEFLLKVLSFCHKNELAEHGEGFWTDHWTYNLDLLESYLAIYPEVLRSLLLDKKAFHFYHNSHYVLPRKERYILTHEGVRQYHSVCDDTKTVKAKEGGYKLRIQNGQGNVYKTTLICKLLCLIVNKAATLDPSGIGIEMEADKPNWYDALNGLPGLLGSSICETLELKRLCLFLLNALNELSLKDSEKVLIFSELHTFITRLSHVLAVETKPLNYWLKATDIKEHYRYRIRQGIDGQEDEMAILEIKKFLELVVQRTNKALAQAKNKDGLYPTYFYHEVTEFTKLDKYFDDEIPFVKPLKFKRHSLPLFLEGFVHGLRVAKSKDEARRLYTKIKKSTLYDKKLKMYKVNTNLNGVTEEVGRTRIFPTGWLENESIWLHMEYKFILELLRTELYEEYFDNFKNLLVPFLNPQEYGRSTLENSSFIVSSAHKDKGLHGRGFVARLSGSTAEFIHMWLYMNVGKQPFNIDKNKGLTLTFKPAIAGWLFNKKASVIDYMNSSAKPKRIKLPKNTYAFKFLGSTLTVYHNPKRRSTYDRKKCRVKKIEITYPGRKNPVTIAQPAIPAPYSEDIRNNKVERIDVYFK